MRSAPGFAATIARLSSEDDPKTPEAAPETAPAPDPATAPERLIANAARMGVAIDAAQARTLLAYLDAVLDETTRVNLTGIHDREEAIVRHLLDSLSVVAVWQKLRPGKSPRGVLDLGTGGGFPGVPLAVVWPDTTVVLADARAKKVRAVERCLDMAPVENADPVAGRGGELQQVDPSYRGAFDLCVARAVGRAGPMLRECHRLVSKNGLVFVMKGPDVPRDELEEAASEAAKRRFRVLPWRKTDVPGLQRRTMLVFERKA